MQKTLTLAALLALAACSGEKKADQAAPASSEAAPADTGMMMHHDSTMARDTSKKM